MGSGRGLNKKRGLESLIPHKIDNEEEKNKDEERSSQNSNTEAEKTRTDEEPSDNTRQNNSANNETEIEHSGINSRKKDHTWITSEKPSSGSGSSNQESTEVFNRVEDESNKIRENGVVLLPLTQVVPNQEQPRKEFKEESIHELAESIRQYGVLQPLLVQKKDKYYVIVAGERRWRVAKEAGLKEIPVILKKFDDQQQMEISLIENIQREDLNVIEEAEAYRRLIDEFDLTQDEVAVKVGKSRSTITNAIRLLKLAKPVRHLLVNGDITMGHARALLSIENEETQINAAHQVIQKKLSVRETEKLVKNILKPRKQRMKPEMDEQTALAYKSIEENLQKLVGSKVLIKPQGDKGKIEIEYYSQEELERIIDLIG